MIYTFKNPETALAFARKYKLKVERDFRIKTNQKTGIQFREYYYKVRENIKKISPDKSVKYTPDKEYDLREFIKKRNDKIGINS